MKSVERLLRELGYAGQREPNIPNGRTYSQPDLVVHNKGVVLVLDAVISGDDGLSNGDDSSCGVWTTCPETGDRIPPRRTPDQWDNFKGRKYGKRHITTWVHGQWTGVERIITGAICLDWRGAWSPASAIRLINLGVKQRALEWLVVECLRGGLRTLSSWYRSEEEEA